MKKYYIYILTAVLPILWGACNNGDDIDTKHSIFSTEPMEHNGFDEWLLANYTYPYNVDFKYRMQDIESDHKYNLVPADYDKSVALAKIIKHVWMEAYTELAGPAFLRSYVPKTFHLIGSPAYDSSGTKVLGTAEGGKKITLYEVNSLDFENVEVTIYISSKVTINHDIIKLTSVNNRLKQTQTDENLQKPTNARIHSLIFASLSSTQQMFLSFNF